MRSYIRFLEREMDCSNLDCYVSFPIDSLLIGNLRGLLTYVATYFIDNSVDDAQLNVSENQSTMAAHLSNSQVRMPLYVLCFTLNFGWKKTV
jgi:hypothetical protein